MCLCRSDVSDLCVLLCRGGGRRRVEPVVVVVFCVTLGATSVPAAGHGADLSRADPGAVLHAAAKTLIGSAGLAPSAVREPSCAADAFWKMPHKGRHTNIPYTYIDIQLNTHVQYCCQTRYSKS